MDNIGTIMLNFTMVITTFWIVSRFLNTLYEKKKMSIWALTVWVVYGVFQFIVQMHSGIASIFTTLISIFLVTLLSLIAYYDFGKMNILIIVLFHAAWALVEMIVFFIMHMTPLEHANSDIIGTIISKIIMVVGIYIFSEVWKDTSSTRFMPLKNYLALLFVPVGSIYIAAEVFYSNSDTEQMFLSMITFSILLLFNIIILEIYSKIDANFMLEKEKAVYTQQVNMMSINTEEQKQIMENFHREKHDWLNKLIVLKNQLENEDKEVAIQSIDKIIKNSCDVEAISNTGNKSIDAILNVKYTVAKEKGIEFFLKIFIPVELPIDQCDIAVVLGNALDNAIEATERCQHSIRKIEIIMGVKKESLVIVIKNPFEGSLKRNKNGNLLSTKDDFNKHGYGINSIKNVVARYGGNVFIDEENGKFVITISMNIPEI